MVIRVICIGLLCFLLGPRAWCDEAPRTAKAATVEPFPDVVSTAQSNGIPISGINPLSEPGSLNVGDSFTALITHFEKGRPHRQWLLYLETVKADSKAKANTNPPQPMVLYTSSGSTLEFVPDLASVTLRTIGPFAEPGKKRLHANDETARFTLNKGFLGLGLDRTAATVIKMNQAKTNSADGTTNKSFAISNARFTEAQIAEGRKTVAARGITPEDERALAGSIPAMMSYFSIVQETKGLESIMLKVVDTPPVWSIVKNRGIRADIGFDTKRFALVDPELWRIPTRPPAYDFGINLSLNDHLAAKATLVVTTPRPPLLTCGGVAGMLVENSSDPGNFLTLKILSARQASKP